MNWPFHFALVILLGLSLFMAYRIRKTKFGVGLIAMREDEDKAGSIGIDTPTYKMLGFVASAVFVGMAGAVYGYYLTFVDPLGMLGLLFSVQIILAVLLGGKGTIWGPVLGAFIIEPFNEFANNTLGGGNVRLVIFGGVLVLVVLLLPQGIIPTVAKKITTFKERKAPALTGARIELCERPRPPVRPALSSVNVLEVKDLSKRFGGLQALNKCSFGVPEGSVTALIGPNGSGKTTVFNILTGMMSADSGEVYLSGKRIDHLPPWKPGPSGPGPHLPDHPPLRGDDRHREPGRPLREFTPAAAQPGGHERRRESEAERLLTLVGMTRYRDRPASTLSYGQRKLVELAQVLALEPRVILLDEPAGGINPTLVERLGELILELNAGGTTFLIVEHNMPFVMGLCDPVRVLARGTTICEGSPEEVQKDHCVLEAYLGGDFTLEAKGPPVMLELKDLTAGYGGGAVLRGVDLTVRAGSIACIVGPNGAGKSTVFRAVSGLLEIMGGSILLDGVPIEGSSPAQIIKAGVAQVPQSNGLFPALTVRENVLMGGYLIRRERALVQGALPAGGRTLPGGERALRRQSRQPLRGTEAHGGVRPGPHARP